MDKSKMKKPLSKKPVNPLHHIRRIDKETINKHAWHVTVVRNKQTTDKHFSDSVHGGKKKSLQAATLYRDELLKETDIYALLIRQRTKLRSNNQTGITGISRVERIYKNYPNSRSLNWIAYGANEDGVICRRYFSIKRYGEAEARQMAIDERERLLNRVCSNLAARKDAHIHGSHMGKIMSHYMTKNAKEPTPDSQPMKPVKSRK